MPSSKPGAWSVRFWVNPVDIVSNYRRRAATSPVRRHRPDHPLGLYYPRGQPSARSSKAFLKPVVQAALFRIQTYLADNGSAFVDHFMNCSQQPSGDHRPTRPVHSKRSNTASSRRVVRKPTAWSSASTVGSTRSCKSHCFDSTEDLKAALRRFVALYNHTFSSEPWVTSSRFRLSNTGKPHHSRLFHREVYKQAGFDK